MQTSLDLNWDPGLGSFPCRPALEKPRSLCLHLPRGSVRGPLVALGPAGTGRLPLSPELTVFFSSSNALLKNFSFFFFGKWTGVFSYTLFLVKHEKGRMPKLVIFIYSRVDPQSLCWGLHVASWCRAPRGTLFTFSP